MREIKIEIIRTFFLLNNFSYFLFLIISLLPFLLYFKLELLNQNEHIPFIAEKISCVFCVHWLYFFFLKSIYDYLFAFELWLVEKAKGNQFKCSLSECNKAKVYTIIIHRLVSIQKNVHIFICISFHHFVNGCFLLSSILQILRHFLMEFKKKRNAYKIINIYKKNPEKYILISINALKCATLSKMDEKKKEKWDRRLLNCFVYIDGFDANKYMYKILKRKTFSFFI